MHRVEHRTTITGTGPITFGDLTKAIGGRDQDDIVTIEGTPSAGPRDPETWTITVVSNRGE